MTPSNKPARLPAAVAFAAALCCTPLRAQPTLPDADRAALQIQTVGGNPVHIRDTVEQIRAALPAAPMPQINLGKVGTLWDQVDGIIFHLYNGVATGIDYSPKSRAMIAGLGVGIDSSLADMEKALGPSQPGIFPGRRAWALDEKRQLVATLNPAGVVIGLELGFAPPLAQRPAGGVVAWADPRAASAAAPAVATPVLTGDARRVRLDQLLAARDDVGLLQGLFPQFQKLPPLPREAESVDRAWLQAHAGEGRASVLYAFSWKLLPFDRDAARAMNARARVEWQLAAAQCAQAPQPGPLMFMLEGEAVVDVGPLRGEKPAWSIALGQALDWDHAQASPVEPDWYCGAGNLMPPVAAAAARQAAWQRAREANPAPTNASP